MKLFHLKNMEICHNSEVILKDKQKKMRAAMMAAVQFMQQEEDNKKKPKNLWSRNGRERMMKNNEFVQRRGKLFGMGRV